MASTIKVNNIQNQCGANIVNKCSTTITLGASGDTIALASGASQTGFGRTGTVNWDTTAKTAGFTAVSGNGYFVNTTSGAITVTLPATPSAGDIVAVKDYAQTFATNNVTLARNSSNIEGVASDITLNGNAESVTFVYVDSTKGWVLVNESTTVYGAKFITATGGTITTCGNYKIHTFTSPGTFCVSCAGNPAGSTTVDYLVVAGGGGGGGDGICTSGGGGGAGGFRYSASTYCSPACAPGHPLRSPTGIPVSVTAYPITVGAGGSGGQAPTTPRVGGNGSNSVFSTITSTAGGGGGGTPGPLSGPGAPGGSGGGARNVPGGTGNTPPTSPSQGNNGGTGSLGSPNYGAGGGGGATAVGSAGIASNPGGGPGGAGAGLPNAFGTSGENCGSYYYFSGGGGGGIWTNQPNPGVPFGIGGLGGGGNAGAYLAPNTPSPGSAGTTNTGGGGGGASGGNPGNTSGGAGGSGIVIIRYKYQ